MSDWTSLYFYIILLMMFCSFVYLLHFSLSPVMWSSLWQKQFISLHSCASHSCRDLAILFLSMTILFWCQNFRHFLHITGLLFLFLSGSFIAYEYMSILYFFVCFYFYNYLSYYSFLPISFRHLSLSTLFLFPPLCSLLVSSSWLSISSFFFFVFDKNNLIWRISLIHFLHFIILFC